MKVGDKVGIARKGESRVSLYCDVESIKGDTVEFWVINGAWSLTMKQGMAYVGKNEWVAAKGEPLFPAEVVFDEVIPKNIRGDYNEAIHYMNAQLNRFAALRLMTRVRIRINARWARLRHACNAFGRAWRGELIVVGGDRYFDTEDDIPL